MKTNSYIKDILLSCFGYWVGLCAVFVTLTSAQVRQASVQEKVIANYPITSGDSQKPIQLSPLGHVLLQQRKSNSWEYSVCDLKNPSQQRIVVTTPIQTRTHVRFSAGGTHIFYGMQEKGKLALVIQETETGNQVVLRDPNADIVSASVSAHNRKILFQARDNSPYSKVYLAESDGSSPRFVTEGMGEVWSPNGEWFMLLSPVKEKGGGKKQRKIDPETRTLSEFQVGETAAWLCEIYSSVGVPTLKLSKFAGSWLRLWSPASNRILVRTSGDPGFWIVGLKSRNGVLAITEEVHILPANPRSEIRAPIWSADGRAIAYIESVLNQSGDDYANSKVWVVCAETTKKIEVFEVKPSMTLNDFVWQGNGKLLARLEDTSPGTNFSIVEVSINKVDSLLPK